MIACRFLFAIVFESGGADIAAAFFTEVTGMEQEKLFLILADLVLMLHVLFVAFVVGGLALIFTGAARAWRWVRNPWFRLAHILAIGFVVVQSWFAAMCPLTTLENILREQAGSAAYKGDFIAHWLQAILYYNAPAWVFAVCYTIFGVLVLANWGMVRPMPFRKEKITVPEDNK
jgi:hypothetical protein